MSKSIEEFLKYAESRMSEIEMYDALIKEAMYKEAFDAKWWAHWLKPSTYVRKVTNPNWMPAYKNLIRENAKAYKQLNAGSVDRLPTFLKMNRSEAIKDVNRKVGKPTKLQFGINPAPTTPAPATPAPAAAAAKTTPSAGATSTGAGTNAVDGTKPTEPVKVPGEEATKDPNLKWKAIGLGGIPAASTLTWLGTSSSGDLEEQNNNLVKQVNDYQQQIQQMRDSAQVGDSFANMNFFERLLFLLLGPAMFKYMGSGSSNL